MMTTMIPFKQLAEQAVSDPATKNLAGQLRSYDELLKPETIVAVDAAHDGVYGILAFDDELDTHIARYVFSGGLEKDSTDHLLILYASGPGESARPVHHPLEEIPGIQLEGDANASYEFVRSAFREGRNPRLPGVLFMSRLAMDVEAVFLSAADTASQNEARSVLVEGFRQASATSGVPPEKFAEKLSLSFARSPLSSRYQRTGSITASEALIKFWRYLLSQRKDIMSAIKLFT
jgi:hypothetical protein